MATVSETPYVASARYVPPRKKRGRAKPKLQPPLTPMIDVTFLLLMYFLLSTTFRQAEGQIPITLPEEGATAEATAEILQRIVIRIRPVGELRHGARYEIIPGGLVAIDDPEVLYQKLVDRRKIASDQSPIEIQPWPDVRWQFVMEAYNQVFRAKFKKIGLSLHGG